MKNYSSAEIIGFEETNSINDANVITHREFYNQIHLVGRPKGHSANKIIINDFDEIFAVKCNYCGEIHPVFKNGKYSVDWASTVQKRFIEKYKRMNHNSFLNCIQLY